MPTTPELTDEEAVVRIQSGDIDMFGVIVDRYEKKLMRYGKKFLSRSEDIEDIVQDVFLKAYRNIQSFDSSLRFSPWIYRIAHNAFVNGLRDKKRGPLSVDFDTLISYQVADEPQPSALETEEMKQLIEKGLSGLSPKYREVLVLHYVEDMAYKDIADILQIPIGTVGIRMRRGKEALKNSIKDHV